MAYKKILLNDDEIVILELRKHVVDLVKPFASFAALSVVFNLIYTETDFWPILLFWLFFGVLLFARYLKYTQELFFITTQRVVIRHSSFHMSTYEIPLKRITAVSSHQSLIGRLLSFGKVTIEHSEQNLTSYELLPRPDAIKRELVQLIQ